MTDLANVIALVASGVLFASSARAEVSVSHVFGDNMVLQRDSAVPVWGWAEPGEEVTVGFADQKKRAKADEEGAWMVRLDPMPASAEGRPLMVSSDRQSAIGNRQFTNVVVGEVWLCSGQSNMEWSLGDCTSILREAVDTADFPLVRHLHVGQRKFSVKKLNNVPAPTPWQVCTPETAPGFTAVGFFFGRRLHQELGVPIGLIRSAAGGTAIEAWTPAEGFAQVPELTALARQTVGADERYRKSMGDAVVSVRKWISDTEEALAGGGELYMPTLPTHPLNQGSNPSMLFNQNIHPLVPCAIRGVIWYQGEANGLEGISYMHKMRALVRGWRAVWGREFPFYYVQLANYERPNDDPEGGNGWARIRMAQLKAMDVIRNTGMAVAIDMADEGNPNDIHPKNKLDVGNRLAIWALARNYGRDITHSGPLYRSMKVKGNEAIIRFDHVGKGLMVGEKTGIDPVKEVEGGALKRFAVCGEDGIWHWADAKIRGKTVAVSSPEVAKPVSVRYAYAMNPEGCNLYNKDDLPASPFTTDDHWK